MKIRIPTKIVISGDVEKAKSDYGFARLQMHILENLMKFQGLQQGSLVRKTGNGSIVECWSCFGLRQISITSPFGGVVEAKKKMTCFCNGCVALGRVLNVHDIAFLEDYPDTETDNLCYDRVGSFPPSESYYCGDVVYDVEVCNEHAYILFLNVEALDNTPYCIGQQVLVSPYPISAESEMLISSACYAKCGVLCFASSPIISVAILPVDASIIPRWIEHHER